ncbi:hypothetical protein KY329_03970, partial [Candidatus Woesearchaeota archaeon]|nr:hypothetical protein [Candidatus Woesearchaeota archaeon]
FRKSKSAKKVHRRLKEKGFRIAGKTVRKILLSNGIKLTDCSPRVKYKFEWERQRFIRKSLPIHTQGVGFATMFMLHEKKYEDDADDPYLNAINYFWSYKKPGVDRVPFGKILWLFELHQDAKENGKEIPLRALAYAAGLCNHSQARSFLNSVGRSAFFEESERFPAEQYEAIRRAYDLSFLSEFDIAEFVGCHLAVVNYEFDKLDKKRDKILVRSAEPHLYIASEVYRLFDQGYSIKAVSAELEKPKEVVCFARDNRHKGEHLERKLVSALQNMFPDEELTKPYLK